jgi:hypothetical protein
MGRRRTNELTKAEDSPVQKVLSLLEGFLASSPQPEAPTEYAKRCGELLGNHLMGLMRGCGELNLAGLHSAAVCLFRPMEDALDLFAAITVIAGAAERWLEGQLKPSDAAKLWTPLVKFYHPDLGANFGDYRKALRSLFNPYTHCDYRVVEWDLYVDKRPVEQATELRVNHAGRYVLELNALRIDAQLVAHGREFLDRLRQGYSTHLSKLPETCRELDSLADEVEEVLRESWANGHLGVMVAPEAGGVALVGRPEPAMVSVAGEWEGRWHCHGEEFPHAKLSIREKDRLLTGTLTIEVVGKGCIRQDLHGIAQGNQVFLDGTTVSTGPAVYAPDRLTLEIICGDRLVGLHKCDLGEGRAEFDRKNRQSGKG